MKHIRAYWVDGKANFGDSVTPELLEFLTGRPVVHADKWHTEILTIGSLLGWALLKNRSGGTAGRIDAARMLIRRFISKPVFVFGTGFLFDPTNNSAEPVLRRVPRIFAVRGRLTLDILRKLNIPVNDDIVLGDPGLFFPYLWPDIRRRSGGARGYIPHESEWEGKKLSDFAQRHPEICLIDVRRSPKEVFDAIASCSEIFSSSLHGLIAADALGVPNRWVQLEIAGRTFEQNRFKFDDYYSAFGAMRDPCEISDIPSIDPGPQIPREHVTKRIGELRMAFSRMCRLL